jgi:hypothetical protein
MSSDVQVPEDQLAIIAGDKAERDIYQLPTNVALAAQEQYARDIARVHGVAVQSEEAEYKEFLSSLGGGPPTQGGGPLGACCASHLALLASSLSQYPPCPLPLVSDRVMFYLLITP